MNREYRIPPTTNGNEMRYWKECVYICTYISIAQKKHIVWMNENYIIVGCCISIEQILRFAFAFNKICTLLCNIECKLLLPLLLNTQSIISMEVEYWISARNREHTYMWYFKTSVVLPIFTFINIEKEMFVVIMC